MDFDTSIHVRIRSSDRQAINEIVHQSQDIYDNEGHFIRCAIIKLINADTKRLLSSKAKRKVQKRV